MQDNKSANTSVSSASSQEDFIGQINTLIKLESEKSKHRESLDSALRRVFNVFGNAESCQICGQDQSHSNHHPYMLRENRRGVDELPDDAVVVAPNFDQGCWGSGREGWLGDINKHVQYAEKTQNMHQFKPKVYVSVNMRDEEPYDTESQSSDDWEEEKSYLSFRKGELETVTIQYAGEEEISSKDWCYEQITHEDNKAIVRSGRLLPFLKQVAKKLEEQQEEYKQVAEVAEKLASALNQ